MKMSPPDDINEHTSEVIGAFNDNSLSDRGEW
jgi:hypothetical protein